MTTHTISLARHTAQVIGLMGVLVLGTWDSYGTEQLLLRPSPEWDGLAIDATFHNVPNDEGVTVLADTDGLVPVPPEACMRASKYATITFRGVQNGVQRISCNLPYMVLDHAQVPGANSTATPSENAQALAQMQDLRDGAVDAKNQAEVARDGAANSAVAAKESETSAGQSAAAAKTAQSAAETAKAGAETAQKAAASSASNASTSASTATTQAAAAESSATTAKASEEAAGKSAKEAAASAENLDSAVNAATQKAEAASASAEAAKASESAAASSEAAARKYANSAELAAKTAGEAAAEKLQQMQAIQDDVTAKQAQTAIDATAAEKAKVAAEAAQKGAAASETAAADSAAAANASEDAAAKSAADADSTANSINNSMMQIAANKEAVSQLKEDLDTLNQGGLNLKEDFIGKQVNNWLDEHPEATTTVQDGSLNEKKIQVSFRRKIKRTYRTFQDVLNDNSLETGTYIETTGFYSVDDGGGGLYLVSTYSPSDGNPCYFSYFGKYIVYIAKENVCNALALGIKKDGSVDCSDIVNKFFANKKVESKRYYSLYFPAGVYLFTNPIKIENATVYANILGCASSRGTYTYVYNDNFYPQYSATVFAFDIPKNTTAMTVNIEKNGSFNMNGITFVSKSSLFKSDGFETRPTVPYNVFSIEKKVENVNGLNIEKCRRSSVENCSFIGFSGYGLRSYSHNILNCFFSNCSVGVENNKSDLMLFNCFITSCENGIKAGCDGVIWASNTFIDQCVMHGILSENQSQTTLVLNGCIIDHIGYSGICVENAFDANIDARMGRCGMYYAGKTTGFPDMPEDEKKKATTIYYGRLFHGNFRLNIYKRSITDDSTNQDYVLPNVVFGGTYTNVVVTGLHYKDYLLFCNKENVHNTTIYADDGIHTYS